MSEASAKSVKSVKSTANVTDEADEKRGFRKTREGLVISDKMEKTVVVAVENIVKHGMYQKYIKRTNKFLAHAENNDVKVGDRVVIEETRPLSRLKRWRLKDILRRAQLVTGEEKKETAQVS